MIGDDDIAWYTVWLHAKSKAAAVICHGMLLLGPEEHQKHEVTSVPDSGPCYSEEAGCLAEANMTSQLGQRLSHGSMQVKHHFTLALVNGQKHSFNQSR